MARKTKVKKSSSNKTEHKKPHHKTHHSESKENSHHKPKSSFFGRIGAFFSEALKAPPEEKKEVIEQQESETTIDDASAKYELASKGDVQKMDESHSLKNDANSDEEDDSDEDVDDNPEEDSKDEKRDEVLSMLNEATNKWKESGDTGLHLEPPKSWGERMRTVWGGMEIQSTRLSGRLKVLMHEVSERVAARQKEAKVEGIKVKTDDLVRDEWKSVLVKLETVSTPSEREEIEKIYKQLENA